MNEEKWICWWRYSSFWKFFSCGLLTVLISAIIAYLIPSAWCLVGILPVLLCGSIIMRRILPDVLMDLMKEMEK